MHSSIMSMMNVPELVDVEAANTTANTTVNILASAQSATQPTTQRPSPNASLWEPTPDTPYEVCFVTAVYGTDPEFADHPPDVASQRDANPTFRYFAFTNMPDLEAEGWTKIITTAAQHANSNTAIQIPQHYRRSITKSRWPKFMGWQHPEIARCQAVFYMDGFCGPKSKHSQRYKNLARTIHLSKYGIAQNKHDKGGGAFQEFDRILHSNKDVRDNVEASKRWMQAQPDFNANCTLYANHYIGYDPNSVHWQQATTFFWDRYSQELDSWRDQPLWCYALDRLGIEPIHLGTFEALFRDYWKRMSKHGHHYDKTADTK